MLADQIRDMKQQKLRGCIVFHLFKIILKDQAINISILENKEKLFND